MSDSKKTKILGFYNLVGKYGYFVLFGFFTQIVSILLPPNSSISDSKEALCNFYITKLNIFHVHIDCDSQYFLLDSQNPMRLINNQTPLQDRPLYTFVVYIFSKFLGLLGVPSGSISYLGEDGIAQTYNILNYGLFIALNAAILGLSIVIVMNVFLKSANRNSTLYKLSIFSVLILVAQNPINREFFWTPHTQIFNILVPALLFHLSQADLVLNKKNFYIWIFSISMALLVYPTFSILMPILFIRVFQSLGAKYAFSLFLGLVPKLIWPYILNISGGDYTDWPVHYHRRFVWIKDSFQSKTLFSDSVTHLGEFINSLPLTWDIISLLLLVLGLFLVNKRYVSSSRSTKLNLKYGSVAFSIYLVAMVLNGAYAPRFSSGIVLLLSFLVLHAVSQQKEKVLWWKIALTNLVVFNSIYWFLGL